MEKNIISFDYAMKEILRNKANFDILSGFLSELLGKNVVVQELIESEGNKDGADDKSNKLDLIAKVDNGEIAIFEVQVNRQHDFFHRILYGVSRAVTQQLSEGDNYGKIKKVYSIDIVYFNLGEGTDYVYRGTTEFKGIHNNTTLLLSSKEMEFLPQHCDNANASELFPEYYIIYPKKFDENIKNKFDEWVYIFKNSSVKSDFTAAGVKEAGEALDKAKMTPAQRQRYDDYIKFERVRNSEIDSAKAEGKIEGKAEGLAEGEAKGKIEIAQKMKQRGISAKEIAELTELSVQEIENL